MMQLPYVTCDVFTDRAFGGNQLAVVYDADGLSGEQMQRIAAEFNYSETTFVRSPKNPTHTAEVRIFTPAEELPFAGHPNVGTAVALAHLGKISAGDDIIFEEKAGLVPIELAGPGSARLTAPLTPELVREVDKSALENLLNLPENSIVTTYHQPVEINVGAHFILMEVDSLEHLAKAQSPSLQAAREVGDFEFYLYTRDGSDADFQARMFAPGLGIVEDPATGGAATALVGLLSSFEAEDGHFSWVLHQGMEMGRPSKILIDLWRKNNDIEKITIGGEAVMMMKGTLAWSSN